MAWEPGAGAGFTSGEPWLPPAGPEAGSVAEQRRDPGSLLHLYRRLIALRRELSGALEPLQAPAGQLAYARGGHAIAINFGDSAAPMPVAGEVVLASEAGWGAELPPSGAAIVRRGGV
jgi:alpha-glucosidase